MQVYVRMSMYVWCAAAAAAVCDPLGCATRRERDFCVFVHAFSSRGFLYAVGERVCICGRGVGLFSAGQYIVGRERRRKKQKGGE